MTAQIDDLFLLRGAEYSVAGIEDEGLFHPSQLGLRPRACSTACWRGYQAVFAIAGERLVLHRLGVSLFVGEEGWEPMTGPAIHGTRPTGPRGGAIDFNNDYVGLDLPLEYDGGVLLARGFLEDLYVHMGFHPAWKYTEVIELVFEAGELRSEHDRSREVATVRESVLADAREQGGFWEPSRERMRELVERSFDRSYDL